MKTGHGVVFDRKTYSLNTQFHRVELAPCVERRRGCRPLNLFFFSFFFHFDLLRIRVQTRTAPPSNFTCLSIFVLAWLSTRTVVRSILVDSFFSPHQLRPYCRTQRVGRRTTHAVATFAQLPRVNTKGLPCTQFVKKICPIRWTCDISHL